MKVFFTCLLMLLSLPALAKQSFLDSLQLRTGLNTTIVEADDLRARVFGLNIGVNAKDKLSKETELFFELSGSFQAGSNESVGNIAEFEPIDAINLMDAGIDYNPWNNIEFTVGALNQSRYLSPLLLDSTAFAAIQEKVHLGSFYLKAQQSIPANNQLTQRVGTVDDATPYFGMETLGYQSGKNTFLKLELSRFQYRDLSGATANISREMGNSVTGVKENSSYNYEFAGTNSMMQFEHKFQEGFIISLWGQYLFNEAAPDGRNSGQLANLGFGTEKLMFYGESFRNESDSSPGFYNSKYYGHNNMHGNSVAVSFNQRNFSFDMKYTNATTIENTFTQSDIQILTLNLVKFYEI